VSLAAPRIAPIALHAHEGETRWFLGTLATIKASAASTGGRVTVIEQLAARGAATPLHVHRHEDEWLYVTGGAVTFWVEGQGAVQATAGAFLYGPRGVPHTFEVTSEIARFLVAAEPGGLEDFVRAVSVPAVDRTLPPGSVQMPRLRDIAAAAGDYGIDILGPPGIPR